MALASRAPLSAQDLTPANEPALTDASPEKEGLVQLLGSLTDKQFRDADAFQAGEYDHETASRFVGKLREKIRAGEQLRGRS